MQREIPFRVFRVPRFLYFANLAVAQNEKLLLELRIFALLNLEQHPEIRRVRVMSQFLLRYARHEVAALTRLYFNFQSAFSPIAYGVHIGTLAVAIRNCANTPRLFSSLQTRYSPAKFSRYGGILAIQATSECLVPETSQLRQSWGLR